MIHRVWVLVFAVCASDIGLADSYNPWPDQRVVSPNGRFYVVMKRVGGPKVYGEWGPVEYIIAERSSDSPPVKSAKSKVIGFGADKFDPDKGGLLYEIKANAHVSIREGDTVLGRGELERPPQAIIVSNVGLGFVGLGVYGYNYKGSDVGLKVPNAAILVSSTGKVRRRLRLLELFTKDEYFEFDFTAGGVHWLNYPLAGWSNDAKEQIVIVGATSERQRMRHLIRLMDWRTGEISKGPTKNRLKDVKKLKRDHEVTQ